MHYDAAAAFLPSVPTSAYSLTQVEASEDFNSALSGQGSLTMLSSAAGNTAFSGDRMWVVRDSYLGNLQVGIPSPTVTLSQSVRGSLTGFGVGTFEETMVAGSATFVASSFEDVVFQVPQPDTSYIVMLESSLVPAAVTDIPTITNKAATGFRIEFGAPQSVTIRYAVYRDV